MTRPEPHCSRTVPDGNDSREILVTRLTVVPKGEAIFHERATHIEIVDEADGEYLRVVQQPESEHHSAHVICIEPGEWPILRSAIDWMIENCRF